MGRWTKKLKSDAKAAKAILRELRRSGMKDARLVGVRMKRPGARWKNDTGHHVMQLRAFALSDRWDQAMDKLFKILRKPVQRVA